MQRMLSYGEWLCVCVCVCVCVCMCTCALVENGGVCVCFEIGENSVYLR